MRKLRNSQLNKTSKQLKKSKDPSAKTLDGYLLTSTNDELKKHLRTTYITHVYHERSNFHTWKSANCSYRQFDTAFKKITHLFLYKIF